MYRYPIVMMIPIILGLAAIFYRTITTINHGVVFDDKQISGAACQIASKFCYQTSYHKYYKVGYMVFPIAVNVLLYLDVFLKRMFGFPLRRSINKTLLPFEIIYGRRLVTSICSDYDYNYIYASEFTPPPLASDQRLSLFDQSPYVVPVRDTASRPNYLVTIEGIELCGFLFLNRSTVIRQKDVHIAFMARFMPFAHVSIVVWFVNGTQISQPIMISGEDFRGLAVVEGFFNYGGSALGGLLKVDLDDVAQFRTLFPSARKVLVPAKS